MRNIRGGNESYNDTQQHGFRVTQPVSHMSRSYATVVRDNNAPSQMPRVRLDNRTPNEHGTGNIPQATVQRCHDPGNYASVTPGFVPVSDYSHQNDISHGQIVNEISEALVYMMRLRRQGPQPPNQYQGHSGL